MSSSSAARMVTLKSSDGKKFAVAKAVAGQSKVVKFVMENCTGDVIPLFNVTGTILVKVIEYCSRHADATASEDELRDWDAEFVKLDQATLFDLVNAANYLQIESLIKLTTKTVADMMKGKTAKEIRKTFNIKNDYTLQEEEEVRRENRWAFE